MNNRHSKFARVSYLLVITCIPLTLIMLTQRLFAAPQLLSNETTVMAQGITMTVSTTDDELNSDGDCSLREAIEAANTNTAVDQCPAGSGWDTIQVPAGTYQLSLAGADEDGNATGDLDILESIDIVGSGSGTTILDGLTSDRILHVDPADAGVTLNLHNVSIINGKSDLGGGLKANNGAIYIYNSSLSHNEALTKGGAIYIEYGLMEIFTTTVEGNSTSIDSSASGGGIHNESAVIRLTGSNIISNTSAKGGGIHMEYGVTSLNNTKVLSNVTQAAAINVRTATTSSSLPPGGRNGGGLNINSGQVHIENKSEIGHNLSANDGGGLNASGSAIFVMRDSWVHHNQSQSEGGGLYLPDLSHIQNSVIEYNIAGTNSPDSGGGIFFEYELLIENSTIANNRGDEGGGIFADGYGNLIISRTVIYSNTGSYGGGVYLEEYAGLYSINSTFEGNVATSDGGGAYAYNEVGVLIENSRFVNNLATNAGGLYLDEDAGLHVDGSTFIGNQATSDGGALYIGDSNGGEIRNSTFTQNHADDNGGAIYNDESTFNIQFSTIVSNSSGSSGGGLYSDYFVGAHSSIIAKNSANSSLDDGTADCAVDHQFHSGGSNLFGNSGGCEATRYDQTVNHTELFTTVLAPLADNGGTGAMLQDGSYPQSFALLDGGPAIDTAGGDFCVAFGQNGVDRPQGNGCDIGATESTFSMVVTPPTDNLITVDSTADELTVNGQCSLREAIMAANADMAVDSCNAGNGWDTIVLPAGTFTLAISGTTITSGDLDITSSMTIQGSGVDDTIIDGGKIDRIFDLDEATLQINRLTIRHGLLTSDQDGGCIKAHKGYLSLFDSAVTGCETNGNAGAIYSEYSVLHIKNSSVSDSVSEDEVGGVYQDSGVLLLQDSRVISNSARYGGGVGGYVGATRINNSQVLSNTSTPRYGGGIFHEYGNLIIENGSEVRHNKSTEDGGGIYFEYGFALIKDSYITDNTSELDGGGIYNSNSSIWIQNSTIENNRAEADGGGISGHGLFENSIIRNNAAITTTSPLTAENNGGGVYGWGIFRNTIIENNRADSGGGFYFFGVILIDSKVMSNTAEAFDGGGAYLEGYGGAFIENSTIQGNSGYAGQEGGGLYGYDKESPIVVRHSTIAGNNGVASGGGIYSLGAADLQNSTISGNSAGVGGGIWISNSLATNFSTIASNSAVTTGGGIYNGRATSIMNSIVAGNTASNTNMDDCSADGPMTYVGHSLFGDGTGCGGNGVNDQEIDPTTIFSTVLLPLADNGGETSTHALQPTSPAIDAAAESGCISTDQRGNSRPQSEGCDIGAYEIESIAFQIVLTGTGGGSISSTISTLNCSADCSDNLNYGTVVTLTAVPAAGSEFVGWSGGCSGTGDCVITVDELKNVTAIFNEIVYNILLPLINK